MLDPLGAILAAAVAGEPDTLIPTFVWQILNFVVLMLILWKLLYKRIIHALDARQKKIASHFEAAEEKEQEAETLRSELQEQRDALDRNRAEKLAEARREADQLRKKLEKEAREAVQEASRRWRGEVARRREGLVAELRRRAGRHAMRAARQALQDVAGADLQAHVAEVLARRLGELDEDERKAFAEAATQGGVVVSTPEPLPGEVRDRLQKAVHGHLSEDAEVAFEEEPEGAAGVTLHAGGREIAWTVDGYLQDLEKALVDVIEEGAEQAADPVAPEAEGEEPGEEADEAETPEKPAEEAETPEKEAGEAESAPAADAEPPDDDGPSDGRADADEADDA